MGFEVIDISMYSPKNSDLFLFDTSVWMHLFCPLGGYHEKEQRAFSLFLKKAQSSKSSIFITSLVLCEIANAYLRSDFKLWQKREGRFNANFKKEFVGSNRYKKTVGIIASVINNILSICRKESDNFNVIEINKILNHFQSIDFNDSYYLELSSKSEFKIVTADYDFIKYRNHGQKIVTIIERKS